MILNVEVGELHIRVSDGRVNLIAYGDDGKHVMLSLSPLAGNNLSAVLPDYVQEAASQAITSLVKEMRDNDPDNSG